MTTIAWDGTMLAADSQATRGGLTHNTQKIFKLKDALIAGVGSWIDVQKFLEWYQNQVEKFPDLDDPESFEAIVITRGGAASYGPSKYPFKLRGKYATGSGTQAAMAAMNLGKSARAAVEVAAKVDLYTGGRVQYEFQESLRKR